MSKQPASIRVAIARAGYELRGYTGQHIDILRAAGCVWDSGRVCWLLEARELPLDVRDLLIEPHLLSPVSRRELVPGLRQRIDQRVNESERDL